MAKTEKLAEKIYVLPKGSNSSTFREDAFLPSLPLPSLEDTLSKYLESVRPFVNAEEFATTERVVQDFKNGVGRTLHKKLAEKAATSRNWLEHWWEEWAYLRTRTPLIPFCSMTGNIPEDLAFLKPNGAEHQIINAAFYIYFILEYWMYLRDGRIKPTRAADKTMFSMSQFRRLFNTNREPGSEVDNLKQYFVTKEEGDCPSHIIVTCRGQMYKVNVLDSNGDLITPPEFSAIFRRVRIECECEADNAKIAVLSCDERTSWSKNRQRLLELSKNNVENLKIVESAICHLNLDETSPANDSETMLNIINGSNGNKWCDKSIYLNCNANGRVSVVSEHSAFDGLASVLMMHYVCLRLEECKGGWGGRLDPRPDVTNAQPIKWDIDSTIRSEILRVADFCQKNAEQVIFLRKSFTDFGKTEIQKCNIHPDTFIQMAMQYAYFKLHNRPAPCYETATTRAFYNGRTETVRSCTVEVVDWVKTMLDSTASESKKTELLKKAVEKHDKLMAEARDAKGCDRHLFGLYCLALEEGAPIHQIYSDPSYSKSGGGGNFILSTSFTGFTQCGGGVAPMLLDGYGFFYHIHPNRLMLTISTFSDSKETDADKFYSMLAQCFTEMKDMMIVNNTKSKI